MNAPVPRRERGLSLVELMVGLAIAAMILVPLLGMLQTTAAASAITNEQFDLQRQADFALERIAARIRATAAPAPWTNLEQETRDGIVRTKFGKVEFFLDATGRVIEEGDGGDPEDSQDDQGMRTLAEFGRELTITAAQPGAGQPMVEVRLALARGTTAAAATAMVRLGGLK